MFRIEAVNRPNVADDAARVAQLQSFFIDDIKQVSLWLTGKQIDENRLAAEIKRANRIIGKTAPNPAAAAA